MYYRELFTHRREHGTLISLQLNGTADKFYCNCDLHTKCIRSPLGCMQLAPNEYLMVSFRSRAVYRQRATHFNSHFWKLTFVGFWNDGISSCSAHSARVEIYSARFQLKRMNEGNNFSVSNQKYSWHSLVYNFEIHWLSLSDWPSFAIRNLSDTAFVAQTSKCSKWQHTNVSIELSHGMPSGRSGVIT